MDPLKALAVPLPGPPTLVVGLGNPVLGDDAVGWRVAEALIDRLAGPAHPAAVEVDCLSLGGLRLMERLVGYERAIVVDAIVTGDRPQGSVAWVELQVPTDPARTHTASAHDTSLATALQVGRALGASLPAEVLILGIEAGPCFEFGEQLSPPVAAAVPRAVELVLEELALDRPAEPVVAGRIDNHREESHA